MARGMMVSWVFLVSKQGLLRLQPYLCVPRCERLVRARAGTCPELHFSVSNPGCDIQSGCSVLQNHSCWCADSSPRMLPQVSTAWTIPDLRAEQEPQGRAGWSPSNPRSKEVAQ